MSLRIVEDGSIGGVDNAPRVVLPAGDALFAERAARFEQLAAAAHPMADFLRFMARVARAQQVAFGARAASAVDETMLEHSRRYGMPPLSALSHVRAEQWRDDLRDITAALFDAAGASLSPSFPGLLEFDDAVLDALADRVLAGSTLDTDAAMVPLVGAALQVYFARLASTLNVVDLAHGDVATVCPVCAMRPLASVVRIDGARQGLRYLHCALCGTEWNMARVVCTGCESDRGVRYLSLEQEGRAAIDAVIRAETCDECKTYLKIFNQEKDPQVEPTADDLASLALDVLVDEQGYARSGPNLLFHPGST